MRRPGRGSSNQTPRHEEREVRFPTEDRSEDRSDRVCIAYAFFNSGFVFPRLTILPSHRTPIQNDLLETWSLLHWLYPDVFTKSTSDLFKDAFALGEGKVDPIFVQHVRRFLEVIMLRRVKESPGIGLDLPAKTGITLYAPLTRLQRCLYRQVLMGVQDDSPSQPSTPSKSAVMQDARHKQLGSALGSNEAGNNNFLNTTTEFNGRNPRTVRNVLMELRKVSPDQHFTG